MRIRRVGLIILAMILLLCSSCQKSPADPSEDEIVEQPEPQYMAYHFSTASRLDDDIYFVRGVSFNKAQIFASEYGGENFETFIPCLDAVCNHKDRSKCCIATSVLNGGIDRIAALSYKDECSLVIYNPLDICLSKPYANVKISLIFDDIINKDFPTNEWTESEVMNYLEALSSVPQKSNPLIYGDYFYYVEIKNGTRTQYRIPLTGGEPERVFEEDNVIIKTIINDRFYGIFFDIEPGTTLDVNKDRDKMHYFRSDTNYENVAVLPEMLDFFSIPVTENIMPQTNAILDADGEYIYVLYQMKVWAIPDSDINAEPILLSDMSEKIPSELSALTWAKLWYNDGVIYTVINTGQYDRSTLDSNGFSNPTQWYEKSTFYSFDIRTGECRYWDISSQVYLVTEILYADDKYVYAEGRYVHEDNRAIQGVTMRLTLDTMRYEVILPDSFWEYSAEIITE